jgi:hypothetical protein
MYNYVLKADDKMTINTPNVKSIDDIKKEIKQTPECIINHSIYPDGLDITFTQYADRIIISSNKELFKNDDGSYSYKP